MELSIARGILLLCGVLCFVPQSLYFTHMLQLNSYRPERFWKWCKETAPLDVIMDSSGI